MMEYEEFKEAVVNKFMNYMPDEMQSMEVRVGAVQKVNETLDSISIVDPQKTRNVVPTFYINRMYEEYKETNDFDGVLNKAAFLMAREMNSIAPEVPAFDKENVKDNIVFQIINTEQNEELLAKVPHRDFQDLSIIYRWVVGEVRDGIGSILITDDMARHIGMNEEQLFRAAVENTRRIFPPVVKPMNDVLREMLGLYGIPKEMIDVMINEVPADKTMWVITNKKGINGATSMLYEDNLHRLAEKLETDLYILPSSVHEVIAIPTDMGNPYELAQMVHESNMTRVSLNERLSNQVYHYDKDLRKITLVTDTPNKRLDSVLNISPNRKRGR